MPDRLLEIGKGNRVDGVEFVFIVEVGVEPVHHHDHFLPARVLGRAEKPRGSLVARFGMARGIGIDDESAVESLVDVPLQRQGMAVIEMAAEGLRFELVDELAAGIDNAGTRHAVHARRMDAVEVHRMGMRAAVDEPDSQPARLRCISTSARARGHCMTSRRRSLRARLQTCGRQR